MLDTEQLMESSKNDDEDIADDYGISNLLSSNKRQKTSALTSPVVSPGNFKERNR